MMNVRCLDRSPFFQTEIGQLMLIYDRSSMKAHNLDAWVGKDPDTHQLARERAWDDMTKNRAILIQAITKLMEQSP